MYRIFAPLLFISPTFAEMMVGMPNPWVDCEDLTQAEQIAGFNFSLNLENSKIRAMKNMIEIVYRIDNKRKIIIRKSLTSENSDISGVYNKYPINETTQLKNGYELKIRGDKDKIYVANINAPDKAFSIYCEQGINEEELQKICDFLVETNG